MILVAGSNSPAQVNNANSPIIFSDNNVIDAATLGRDIDIGNPVQVLGTGGSLVGNVNLTFLNPFAGSGNFTLNLNSSNSVNFGGQSSLGNIVEFSNGLTLQSGSAQFYFASNTIKGDFSVVGSSRLAGNVLFASNHVTGNGGATLRWGVGSITFTGAGSSFNFDSNILATSQSIYLANTSQTQNFGGTIAGNIYRLGNGGTSVFSSLITGRLLAYGGTTILRGSSGAVTGNGVTLRGGKVILDNAAQNNNSRLSGSVIFEGGEFHLKGVNGGSTVQNLSAPTFNQGHNKIDVAAGDGVGSTASLVFGGPLTHSMTSPVTVDFQGLTRSSQVFFTGQTAGPIAPWATVNGTDFATYGSDGVQAMSTADRPSQVGEGMPSSYVLGSGLQTTLANDVQVTAVTMTTGTSLDLGGHELIFGGWIQNGGPATISNGAVSNQYPTLYHTYITTNADLILRNTTVSANSIVKNGSSSLTLDNTTLLKETRFYVNDGTLALNLASPMKSIQNVSSLTVGDAAGDSGSAVLSLLADDQFISNGVTGTYVGVEVMADGIFKTNGHQADLSFLKVNGGTADLGGGEITVSSVASAGTAASPGKIVNGTINIDVANNPSGAALAGGLNVESLSSLDALTIDARIVSSSVLEKSGDGTVVLSNAENTYGNGTVGLILQEGTVALKNSGAAGSADQRIQFDGGALRADSDGILVLSNTITGGSIITSGSDMVFASGYRQTTYQAGFANTNSLTVNGYTIDVANGYMTHGGTGALILGGTASGSTTGEFIQAAGKLIFDSDQPLPEGMVLVYQGGSIEGMSRARAIHNRLVISNDITFSGSKNLTFAAESGNSFGASSSSVRNVYVNGTGVITINNLSGGRSSTLILGSTGTLVLSGNASGFRTTTINKGTLRIQNYDAEVAALGAVAVNSQGIIGGIGALEGMVTVAGGGMVDPGAEPGSIGTMNFKTGLALNAGAGFRFDLGQVGGADLIQITGGLFSITGTGVITINLQDAGDFGEGTYTLISWINRAMDPNASFVLGNKMSGYDYNLFISGNSLKIIAIAVPEPASICLLITVGIFLISLKKRKYGRHGQK